MLGLVVAFALFVKIAGTIIGFLLFIVAVGAAWSALMNGAIAGAEAVDDALLALPIIGPIYARFFRPSTYFSEDTRLIFQESVHAIVLHAVEALLNAHGARALAPEEARPQSRPAI